MAQRTVIVTPADNQPGVYLATCSSCHAVLCHGPDSTACINAGLVAMKNHACISAAPPPAAPPPKLYAYEIDDWDLLEDA